MGNYQSSAKFVFQMTPRKSCMSVTCCCLLPHVRDIQDSLGFLIPRCGFQIFQVFVSGTLNLDPNRYWDSGFLELYSGFQSPRPSIPKEKNLFQIPESGYPYMGLSNPIGFSPDFRFSSKPTHPNFSSF